MTSKKNKCTKQTTKIMTFLNFKNINSQNITISITTLLLAYVIGLHQLVSTKTKLFLRNIYVVIALFILCAFSVYNKKFVIALLILLSIYVTFPHKNKSEGFNGHCNWASTILSNNEAVLVPYKNKRYVRAKNPPTQIYRYDKAMIDEPINT